MKINKKLLEYTGSAIFSLILTNVGLIVVQKERYIGIITALIGFALLYFSYYVPELSNFKNKIQKIEEWTYEKEELLNTLKDIVILKKVSKIK